MTSRQRILLFLLSAALFLGGLAILLFLKRLPLPARIVIAALDVAAALTLLVVIKQDSDRNAG